MTGIPDLESAIYARLTGNAAVSALVSTRVYNLQAPSGATYPLIVFNQASGLNLNIIKDDIWRAVYRVACWSSQSAKKSAELAEAVGTACHQLPLTLSGGWNNHHIAVTNRVQRVETVGGNQLWVTILDIEIELS